jgi:hypothetical protein
MSVSKAKSVHTIRQEFLGVCSQIADYWAAGDCTKKDACHGVVFSMLGVLDGVNMNLPAFDLHVAPAEEDKAHYMSIGEDYYAPGTLVNADMLHDEYVKQNPPGDANSTFNYMPSLNTDDVETVTMYKAKDGEVFDTPELVRQHEAELDFKEWYSNNLLYGNYAGSHVSEHEFKKYLRKNADKLRFLIEK